MTALAEWLAARHLKDADIERFLAKVDRIDINGCHVWTGRRFTPDGYGVWELAPRGDLPRQTFRAHRLSLILAVGPLDQRLACHKCNNPRCARVDPAHVYAGSHKDNTADMFAAGTHWIRARPELLRRGDEHPSRTKPECLVRGESHHMVTRSDETVAAARRAYSAGASQYQLARDYGVAQPTISTWVRGVVRT